MSGAVQEQSVTNGSSDDYYDYGGSTPGHVVDAGPGTNTLHLVDTTQSNYENSFSGFYNFDSLVVASGIWYNVGEESFRDEITVDADAALTINDGFAGRITNNGTIGFLHIADASYTGLSGSGQISFESSGTVRLYGENATTGYAIFFGGTLEIATTGALGTTTIGVGEGDAATIKIPASRSRIRSTTSLKGAQSTSSASMRRLRKPPTTTTLTH